MSSTDSSLQYQRSEINNIKQRKVPVSNIIGGNIIVALPNVYAGWLDSELICETIKIPPGASVLDLCTGTGVIAVKAAQLGASQVVAVDLNPEAVKNTELNAKNLGLGQIEVREGSLFEPVEGMQFDVIIINPPYVNHKAIDKTEICFWDEDNRTTRQFFKQYRSFLRPNGCVYFAWGDFADTNLLHEIAKEHSVTLKLVGSKTAPGTGETFLVFRLEEL